MDVLLGYGYAQSMGVGQPWSC